MNIRLKGILFLILLSLGACRISEPSKTRVSMENAKALTGTWKLVSNEVITNGQPEQVFPVEGQK